MPRLLLVRHAQSQNNASNDRVRRELADQPERIIEASARARVPDPDLTATGREQAARLAEALAPLAAEPRTLLVSSPMRRALQTATELGARAGLGPERVRVEGSIYEVGGCFYGDEARPSSSPAQIEAEFPVRCGGVPAAGWFAGRERRESEPEVHARVAGVIDWAEATLASGAHDTVIVIAHGELMSLWLRRWLELSASRALAFVHANTGVSTFDWRRDRGLLVRRLNEVGHLPPDLRTGESDNWWRYAAATPPA